MPELVSRQALYDLVWSEPANALAMRFGVSGPAIAKACRRLHVPPPPRGFRARTAAGRAPIRIVLPPRPPGLDDETMIGGGPYWWHDRPRPSEADLLGPLPPEQTFEEPIEVVRQWVEAALRQPRRTSALAHPHPAIARLLQTDEVRQAAVQSA